MFYSIIQNKAALWAQAETCPAAGLLRYIRDRGKLRETQIAAIETYLFLKIEGGGRSLATLFSEGFFNRNEDLAQERISQIARDRFEKDPAARALFELCSTLEKDKGARNKGLTEAFERHLTAHPDDADFHAPIHDIFYKADYTDYLFSLPMGAGKTFLMAAFIYLDLYFSLNEPENKAFARNFIVLAPSGLKSSIIPSLRNIEHFDPSWVLAEPAASEIRKLIKFEVLDQSKSGKKSNRARNPNAQKVAAHRPFEDLTGLVLVVNAEKVILDRVELDAQQQLIERNDDEKERLANELRHLIGQIPGLQIYIDEVQRASSGDIKLRAVVNGWCKTGQISAVLGFSGTPYHDAPRLVDTGPVALQSSTIANTVYYYPLTTAIASFLKKPRVEVARGLESLEIVRKGVKEFLKDYGQKRYDGGACAKLAVYCGTIARLEEEIYPLLVGELGVSPARILKYHQGNKAHAIHKEAASEFALLDSPISQKQIVLLVQIGKEGWDCRSLTAVVLSQEGDCPRNMVLQTSCRCLRQVDGGPGETALILLNEENAKTLDKQLGEEQNTSIRELNAIREAAPAADIPRFSRMEFLKLPPVEFYRLKVKYSELIVDSESDPAIKLRSLDPDQNKTAAVMTTRYLNERHAADNNAYGIVKEEALVDFQAGRFASFSAWLDDLVRESLGRLSFADLHPLLITLWALFERVTFTDGGIRRYNTLYDQSAVRSRIRLAFHAHRELKTEEEVVPETAHLLLVDKLVPVAQRPSLWPDPDECDAILSADKTPPPDEIPAALLEEKKRELEKTAADLGMPEMAVRWLRDWSEKLDSQKRASKKKDRTLHYLPYDFRQSDFERRFLDSALVLGNVKDAGLEIYYNGERQLTGFRIGCYVRRGRAWRSVGDYTPDFLVIKRDARHAIRKILILETKGSGFIDQKAFQDRRAFMANDFVRLNNEQFKYRRFDFMVLSDERSMDLNLAEFAGRIKSFFLEE